MHLILVGYEAILPPKSPKMNIIFSTNNYQSHHCCWFFSGLYRGGQRPRHEDDYPFHQDVF
ncbi:MAG: hypothetical protein R2788_06910 [Saprospiraceae bacterium]